MNKAEQKNVIKEFENRKQIILVLLGVLSFCGLFAQSNQRKDSLLERQINKAILEYPKFLSNSGESAVFLVKVKIGNKKDSLRVELLNESRKEAKDFFQERLRKIDFKRCLKKGETLIIPVFFLISEDAEGRKIEFLKVRETMFHLFRGEDVIQNVKLLRPTIIWTALWKGH